LAGYNDLLTSCSIVRAQDITDAHKCAEVQRDAKKKQALCNDLVSKAKAKSSAQYFTTNAPPTWITTLDDVKARAEVAAKVFKVMGQATMPSADEFKANLDKLQEKGIDLPAHFFLHYQRQRLSELAKFEECPSAEIEANSRVRFTACYWVFPFILYDLNIGA